MTDISGVAASSAANALANTATGSTNNTTSSGEKTSGELGTARMEGNKIVITQPDGKQFVYTIPTAGFTEGPNGPQVVNTPGEGMEKFAKTSNRSYGTKLDADDFMKLLVAQLRFQDPTKPADTTAMMQQTAAMAMVERVNELADAAENMTKSSEMLAEANEKLVASNEKMGNHLNALFSQQSLSAAIGMIGKNVTYIKGTGEDATTGQGVVESVKIGENGPILTVNGTDVPVADLTGVGAATGTTPAGTAEAAAGAAQASSQATEDTAEPDTSESVAPEPVNETPTA